MLRVNPPPNPGILLWHTSVLIFLWGSEPSWEQWGRDSVRGRTHPCNAAAGCNSHRDSFCQWATPVTTQGLHTEHNTPCWVLALRLGLLGTFGGPLHYISDNN